MVHVPVEEIVPGVAACLHLEAGGREGNFSRNSLIYHARKPRAFFVFLVKPVSLLFPGNFFRRHLVPLDVTRLTRLVAVRETADNLGSTQLIRSFPAGFSHAQVFVVWFVFQFPRRPLLCGQYDQEEHSPAGP